MAIKLRTNKGTALTHLEVDENFASNIYSASLETGSIALYYTASDTFGPTQKVLQIPLQWKIVDGVNIARNGDPGTIVKISGSIQTGLNTTTPGLYSYAGGIDTVADGPYQQVQGAYNISSSSPAAFIVGNGSSTTRSNLIFASASQVQITGSLLITGSNTLIGAKTIIGSVFISGSNTVVGTNTITGSLLVSGASELVGNQTILGSLAQGSGSLALGSGSHAEGLGTVASGSYQHVQGQYNISSSAQSAFILGNGSLITRSNLIFASGSQVQITGSLNITGSLQVTGSIFGDGSKLSSVNALTKVFYVTENGNDSFDGKTLQTSFRTIKRACTASADQYAANPTSQTGSAPYRININVKSGYYSEDAPVIVPAFTTINGNDLRSVIVAPSGSTSGSNLFQLNNATYIYGLRLEGCVLDSLEDPRQGFYFAYQPGAYLTTSPYIQNCTAVNTPFDKFYTPLSFEDGNSQVGNGPGGMIVDDSVLDPYSPLKSMIVDAYTQVAFNGIGICLRGRGYGQMVSFFTNFSRVGVFAIDGGHASLLNSNTTFGDYGLRTSGSRIMINPDTSTVDPAIYTASADLLSTLKGDIQSYEIAFLQASGSTAYTGSVYAGTTESNALLANCKKDAEYLVDALVADLKSSTATNISRFTQGYFKAQDISTNTRYTLPSASNAYTKGVITVIPQKSGSDAGSDGKKFTKDYLLTFNAIADYIYTSSLSAPAKAKVRQLVNTLNHTISSVVLQEKDRYKKVAPNTSAVPTTLVASAATYATTIENARQTIITNEIDYLVATSPNSGRYTNTQENAVVRAKCATDAGQLIDAIKADLLTTGSGYTVRFTQAYFPPISGSTATRVLNSGLGTAVPDASGTYTNIAQDYLRAFTSISSSIVALPGLSEQAKTKVAELIKIPSGSIADLVVANPATSALIQEVTLLEEFGSLITSTSHDFSYAGSGVNYLAFPNNQGGTGKTSVERRIFNEGLGRVYHTSGDETGDFYAGDDFVIRQDTGTIDGRSFSKSVSALTIPINLALEG